MKPRAEPRTPLFVKGAGLSDRVEYRVIESPEDRDAVYSMRYRAYLHGGLIVPSESQRIIDTYDESPNAWLFGIYIDGELCSAFRIHVLTSEWRTSYTAALFGDVLDSRLDQGEVFVDPARLCADPEKSQLFPELPYLALRLGYVACDHFNANTGLMMVRTDHEAFYRRVFLSKTIAGPRAFPGWHTMQVALTASDFRNSREAILSRFPIMRSTVAERRMLFDRGSRREAAPRPSSANVSASLA